jgi:SAM-dependent methyltransferase
VGGDGGESLRDAWDAQAENWAAWARRPGHDEFYWRFNMPRFLELVPTPGRLTIDLGCGEGRLGRLLRDNGHRVVSIDSSQKLAALTATHEESQPIARGDMAALPFRGGVADLAIAFMSLQDVDDMPGAVNEAGRVLEPGGRLCLAILHPFNSACDIDPYGDVSEPFVIRDPYRQPRRLREPLERDGLHLVFNSDHRPLESYMRALEECGFLVEALREPVPDDDHVRDNPRMVRPQRLPWFLHLRAVKAR